MHGDLQHHSSGCYSAESQVKRYNRKAENALLRAEKFSVLTELVSGHGYTEGLTEGWKRVLFNQFPSISVSIRRRICSPQWFSIPMAGT